jgi:hypothetical protein
MNRRSTIMALVAGTVALAPGLALGAVGPGATEGSPTQPDAPVVRLVIDTSGMFENHREDTARWIREDGLPVLADAGVTVDDANAELEVHVVVMAEGVGFAVEVSVWKAGADRPEVDRGHRVCQYCVRSEVLQLVTRELTWIGGWLAVRPIAPEPAPEPEPEPEAAVEPEAKRETVEPQPEPPRSMMLRDMGLALVVPGGVALGVGIGLIAAGVREVDDDDVGTHTERNYRPAGVTIAVSGAVAASIGAALLLVHARRGRDSKDKGIAWSPVIGRAHAGIVVVGRF